MKGTLKLFIALLVFTLATPPQLAFAAVKAGSTCTKLNSTTTVGGYRFTCIKSGKKLVWSKGVKVVIAKPTQTPIPTVEPVQPNGKCPKEGDIQPLNGGEMICTNGTWQPFNRGTAGTPNQPQPTPQPTPNSFGRPSPRRREQRIARPLRRHEFARSSGIFT